MKKICLYLNLISATYMVVGCRVILVLHANGVSRIWIAKVELLSLICTTFNANGIILHSTVNIII